MHLGRAADRPHNEVGDEPRLAPAQLHRHGDRPLGDVLRKLLGVASAKLRDT